MLRDKFAMAAMQAMFSDPGLLRATSSAAKDSGITLNQMIAKSVYETADAMMKERANWDFSTDPEAVTVVHNANHIHHGVDAPGKATGVPGEWQPDWNIAREWANWFAIDGNGDAYWYELEPKLNIKSSDFREYNWKTDYAPSFGYKGDWRESLRKRPTE